MNLERRLSAITNRQTIDTIISVGPSNPYIRMNVSTTQNINLGSYYTVDIEQGYLVVRSATAETFGAVLAKTEKGVHQVTITKGARNAIMSVTDQSRRSRAEFFMEDTGDGVSFRSVQRIDEWPAYEPVRRTRKSGSQGEPEPQSEQLDLASTAEARPEAAGVKFAVRVEATTLEAVSRVTAALSAFEGSSGISLILE